MCSLKDSVFFTKLLLLVLQIISLKTLSPKFCLMSYTAFRKLFKFAMFHQYEAQLAQVHEECGKEKNHLCEGSSQLLHWCVLLYRLLTANQCHGFPALFTNQCTLFYAVQLILAWQQAVNKAVLCQTVNSFPFAHHPWILPEEQATISGYWPRQAPEGNLTISISCQNEAGEEAGSHLKAEQCSQYSPLDPWGRRQALITWCKVALI